MAFALKPRQTIVFTGDSITDCGRRDAASPLGNGYAKMICDLIVARYPAHQLRTINTGSSGHTVRDLSNRWTDDVIRHRPDWVSIMIGINDVHRWLAKTPDAVSAKEYAQLYDGILARVTLVGACYLAVIALLPEFMLTGFKVAPIPLIGERLDSILPTFITQGMNVQFYFGGTSLLIIVGVAMDTVQQVESQLIMRHYDGFMKKTRIRGRRG